MKTLVLGGDGNLGCPTALHLSEAGHEVAVADSFIRRHYATNSASSPWCRSSSCVPAGGHRPAADRVRRRVEASEHYYNVSTPS